MHKTMIYNNFRQDAPGLNEAEAWPKSVFPDADYTFFRECGCLICALAVMLRHTGIERNADEKQFNPWILNQRLIACEAFTPAADLKLQDIRKLYPLQYMGSVSYTREALDQMVESGSPCLITVPGILSEKHFITPLSLLSNEVLVFDPLYGERKLGDYKQVYEIRAFQHSCSSL